jgi:DNA-binding response OmpR family regulator
MQDRALSGDTLAGLFKRHAQLSAVPLLLFSSNEEGELRRMARELGVLGYISKSDTGDGLSRRIRGFLERASADCARE